jgi:hypothetical protein
MKGDIKPTAGKETEAQLLTAMKAGGIPDVSDFRNLIERLAHHHILARVFLLDGTPHVFISSPMKYIIFKEQVASEFGIGSQDVCIVGSARLGFSPSPHKFGRPFSETSDVDVVLISEPLFLEGSQALFQELNSVGPPLTFFEKPHKQKPVEVEGDDWKAVKEAIRNFVFNNFNPGLLPYTHPLRTRIFNGISGTTGLFLALEPQVFVSKIRCRIFRTWRAAEDYYANSLRQAQAAFRGDTAELVEEEDEESLVGTPAPN